MTPPWRWRSIWLGLSLVAVVGGVVLRVATPSPLWLDEALSVNIAQLGFGDMVDALRHDGHPALYYVLLGLWIDLFGDSDVAVRSLSALFSLLTVPVVWLVARRQGTTIASIAGLLALSSPYLLRYGSEARMYALVGLLTAIAWLMLERALESPTRPRLVALAASTAALVHTHYWTFWLVGAALIFAGWNLVRGDVARRAVARRLGLAILAGSATLVVWLSVFFDQLTSTGTPWADRARPAEIAIETIQAVGGNNRFEGELLGVMIVVLALVGAVAESTNGRRLTLSFGRGPLDRASAALLLTLGIGGSVAFVTAGAFEARYAAVIVVFIIVLSARGIAMLPANQSVVVLVLVVLFGLAVGVDEARRDRTQGADVATLIDDGFSEGDVVAFCPDQVGPATLRSLASSPTTLAYPSGDGLFVDWQDYADMIAAIPPEAFVDDVLVAADGNDVWMVLGLGYKSLGNRCEAISELLGTTHQPHHLLSPSEAFEPMLLTRYEERS